MCYDNIQNIYCGRTNRIKSKKKKRGGKEKEKTGHELNEITLLFHIYYRENKSYRFMNM